MKMFYFFTSKEGILMKRAHAGLIVFLLIVVMSTGQLYANESDSGCTMKATHRYGFLGGGFSWFDDSKLNEMLTSSNLPKFKEYAMTVSLGGRKDMGKLIMESVITGYFWKNMVSSTNQRVSLMSGDIMWNHGYNFLTSGMPLTLFPYVGLGVGINTMQLRSDRKTFSELVATAGDPDHALFLSQGAVLFNVGLGSDLFLVKPDKTKTMVIGIRAGYSYDLYTGKKWYSNGTTVSDLPSLHHNGGYVRLVIGGEGNHNHHEKSPSPTGN
jgi:hypothetical protein